MPDEQETLDELVAAMQRFRRLRGDEQLHRKLAAYLILAAAKQDREIYLEPMSESILSLGTIRVTFTEHARDRCREMGLL